MAKVIKQVMDLKPGKGISVGQSDEHQRNWTDKGWEWAVKHGNYDPSRASLNFEIARGGKIVPVDKSKTIPQRMAEDLRQRGIKDPNEGLKEPKFRTVVNIIFGGSTERMLELAFGDQKIDTSAGVPNPGLKRMPEIEQWALDMYRFSCDKWGEENITAFIVHLDEKNPHIHATILPIDKVSNRFSFNKIFGGNIYATKEYITRLHDELAAVNKKWGLDRGDNIHETGARHRSTEEYRRELSRECTTLEQQIEENSQLLQQLHADIRFAEKRVKGLSTMIANLDQKKNDLENEIEQLASDLREGNGNSEELQKKIRNLDFELQKVLVNLADKQEKLKVADAKLSELKEIENESRKKTEDYRTELRNASYNMEKQIRFRLADALMFDILEDFKIRLPELGIEAKKVFDDSLLKSMAEQGEHILKCAVFLYANYVDMATTFAKNNGGGGTSSDLPWGRKDDEDDRAWARRCLFQAHRMMRPAGGKNVRRK